MTSDTKDYLESKASGSPKTPGSPKEPIGPKDPQEPKAIGRPKNSEVVSKKKGHRKKVGRPKGDAAIINEYKARMLASPKSRKVLDAIFEAALDHEHKNQAAAWKLVMDRVAPVAAFEKEVIKGSGGKSIQINITGLNADAPPVATRDDGDIIDHE